MGRLSARNDPKIKPKNYQKIILNPGNGSESNSWLIFEKNFWNISSEAPQNKEPTKPTDDMNDPFFPYHWPAEPDPFEGMTDEERMALAVLQLISFFAVMGVALAVCAVVALLT